MGTTIEFSQNPTKLMKYKIYFAFSILLGVLVLHPGKSSSAAAIISPSEVIAAINSYRVQNGLPQYSTNSILMGTAQDQSNHQASIGTVTHSGPGGSRPIDRAYAAGYGDGQVVFVSEIIYGGYNATVSDAISWWKNSQIHNDSMLSTYSQEIGAGVATDGTWVYFTAVMGYVAGGEAPPDAGSDAPSGAVFVPVIVATPNADGLVVHVVESGQILINIAIAYDVTLEEIYLLNDLNQFSYIFPGDEILIKEAAPVEATQIPPPSPTAQSPTPVPTIPATETPTPSVDALSGASGLSENASIADSDPTSTSRTMQTFVTIVVAVIFLIFTGSFLIPRKKDVEK